LPSDLTPSTRECAHLVTRDHFRSRDKDGGHTIRSAMPKTPCCTQTSRLYVLQKRCYFRSKFYIAGIGILLPWPWTWPDYLHIRTWPVFPGAVQDDRKWTSYDKAFKVVVCRSDR